MFTFGPAADGVIAKVNGEVAVDTGFTTATRVDLDSTSWVDHVHGSLAGDESLMQSLMDEAPWLQRERWMYTRKVQEPRLTAEYPVIDQAPLPALRYIADALSARYRRPYTRLWMNWYRDNNDGTGWHADRPANKQDEAVIPVLSLGAARKFLIRPVAGGPKQILRRAGRRSDRDGRSMPKGLSAHGAEAETNNGRSTEPQLLIDLWSTQA